MAGARTGAAHTCLNLSRMPHPFSLALSRLLTRHVRALGLTRRFALAVWVPLGGLAGALGAAIGALLAALATPTEEDLESPAEWMRSAGAYYTMDHGRYSTVGLSVAGAAALSAGTSGLVAWSVNEHPHYARARLMWLLQAALFHGFFARHGFKVWRAGGRAKGGRMRLMTREGCGCRGCVWPALL